MAISSVRQSSFAAGEVSPSFFGRMDFAKFDIALRKCRNWLIGPHGSAFNRPGTQYVATTKTTGNKVRLIPFQFSDGQAYALEFGNLYVRFHKDGLPISIPSSATAWVASTYPLYAYVSYPNNTPGSGHLYLSMIPGNATTPGSGTAWLDIGVLGAVLEVVTPYVTADLPYLKYAQSGDVITFASQNHVPYNLSRYSTWGWKFATAKIGKSGALTQTLCESFYITTPDHTEVVGSTTFHKGFLQQNGTRTFPLVPDVNHTVEGYKLWGYAITLMVDGVETLPMFSNELYMLPAAVTSNYGSTTTPRGMPVTVHWDLTTVIGTGISVQQIRIYKGRTGTYGLMTILDGSTAPQLWTDDGTLAVDFSSPPPTGGGFPGSNAELNGGVIPNWAAATIYYKGDRVTYAGHVYEAENFGISNLGTTPTGPTHTAGSILDRDATIGPWKWGEDKITFLQNHLCISNGHIYKKVNAGSGTIEQQDFTQAFHATSGPWAWLNGVAEANNGTCTWDRLYNVGSIVSWKYIGEFGYVLPEYPGVVVYVDQRLIFANSLAKPGHIWGSEVGDYRNFFEYHLPTIASDPYDFDLAYNQYEEIRGFISAPKAFMAMSSAVEWALTGGTGDAITATNINARANSQRGCSWLDPKLIGSAGVFVQARLPRVRELVFDWYTQSYGGNDLSALAPHLFDGYQIVDWAYQKLPIPTMWLVRSDGKILSCTYIKEQDFIAWSWHDTQGGADLIENVCVVSELDPYSTQTAYTDMTYVVVKRGSLRFVERVVPSPSVPVLGTSMGVFLDSAVVRSGSPATILTGLGNMESRSVMVLGDDNVYGPYTVSGGQIDISADCPDGVSRSIVGLTIYSDIEFLPPKIPGPDLKRSNVKIVQRISVELANSRGGLWFGPDYTHMNEWRQRDVTDEYGAVHPYTGLDHVRLSGVGYDHDATLCIRQIDPLPVNLLAIEREIDVGGD